MNVYEMDGDGLNAPGLRVLRFEAPSVAWAMFVMNNRSNAASGEHNLDLKYDVVTGPIANDDLSLLFRQFSNGFIDREGLMKGMEFKKLTDQYSFHTEKAVELLRKEGDYLV